MPKLRLIEVFYGGCILAFIILTITAFVKDDPDFLIFLLTALALVVAYDTKKELEAIKYNSIKNYLIGDLLDTTMEPMSLEEFEKTLHDVREEEDKEDGEDRDEDKD